jgi:hypothetical protein
VDPSSAIDPFNVRRVRFEDVKQDQSMALTENCEIRNQRGITLSEHRMFEIAGAFMAREGGLELGPDLSACVPITELGRIDELH